MNIKEFRAITDAALRAEGLEERQLEPKGPKVWTVPDGDVIRFFRPHAYRRSWGFVYSGLIGIEVPALRTWLQEHKPGEQAGILRGGFVGHLIANEDVLREFMACHDYPVPADLWAGLLKDRLLRVPDTLDELIATYRSDRERLGWLAHPSQRHAWDFLLKWQDKPDPSLYVPRMLPNGYIV